MSIRYQKSGRAYFLAAILMLIMHIAVFGQKWGEIDPEEWALQPPSEYPEAAAAIIFDHGVADISAYDGLTLERHVRIKVFDKDRADKALTIEIPLYEGDDFSGFKGHTITPDGREMKVKDKFEKKAGGNRIVTFTFPGVVDGSIVEYKYKHFNERLWMLDPWFFQNEIYTFNSKYTMSLHQGFTYGIACSNVPYEKKDPVREDDRRFGVEYSYFTWELDNLMPIEEEPKSSARLNAFSALYIQLTAYKDPYNNINLSAQWGDLGEILQKFLDEYSGKSDGIEKTAGMLVESVEGDEEKIKTLYCYVRDNIATIDNDDRFLPSDNVKNVLKDKKGSAVQKNALLTALMASLGFEAGNVLIGTRDYVQFNPNLKQFIQFNHLISMVELDGKQYLFDASSYSTSFPFLPPPDLIYNGLLVDGKESRIISIEPLSRKSSQTIHTSVNLDGEGAAECSTRLCLYGNIIHDYRDYLGDSLTEVTIVDDLLEKLEAEHELLDKSVFFDSQGDSLLVNYTIQIPEFAEFLADKMVIPLGLFSFVENPFKSEKRMLPIDFMYTYDVVGEVEITLPDRMTVVEIPPHIDEEIDGIRYYRGAMAEEGAVKIKSVMTLKKPYFKQSEYEDLRNIFNVMEQSALDQIVLETNHDGAE